MTVAPNGDISLRLEQSLSTGHVIAKWPSTPSPGVASSMLSSLVVRKANPATELDQVIAALRHTAASSIGGSASLLGSVLDAYALCLETYAARWRRYVGNMDPAHMEEPLRIPKTPISLITDAVASMMETALKDESGATNFRPGVLSRSHRAAWGARVRTSVQRYARSECSLLLLGKPQHQDRRRPAQVRSTWIHVAEHLQWTLPGFRAGYAPSVDPASVTAADDSARGYPSCDWASNARRSRS